MRRLLIPLLLLASLLVPALAAGPATAEDETTPAWPELKRRAAMAFAAPGRLGPKRAAAGLLATDNREEAWALLFAALEQEGRHLDALATARADAWAAAEKLWSLPRAQHHAGTVRRLQRAFEEVGRADRAWFRERLFVGQLSARLGQAPAAMHAFLRRELTGPVAMLHPTTRAEMAYLLARDVATPAGAAAYRSLLERDEHVAVRLAALASLPAEGRTVGPLILRRLRDRSWVVRIAAARLLAERGLVDAVPMLEDALSRAGPREAVALRAALRELGVAQAAVPAGPVTLFGDPLPSERVVFVLDASRAMRGAFDAARVQVIRAIRALPASGAFGVVVYHGSVMPWRTVAVPATDANKEDAIRWLAGHAPAWIACLDGGLRAAFRIAGLAPQAEVPQDDVPQAGLPQAIDTIAILAAGAPVAYGPDKARRLRRGYLERLASVWNLDGRIRIQCVSLGAGDALPVLTRLARDHGGTVTVAPPTSVPGR